MDVGSGDLLGVQIHGIAEVGRVHYVQQNVAQEQQHHQRQDQANDAQSDCRLQIGRRRSDGD